MFYTTCNFCHSDKFKIWGVSVRPSDIHHIQVRCKNCGLFYVNPQATVEELREYYKDYYSRADNFHSEYKDKVRQAEIVKNIEYNLSFIKKHVDSGNLLDIGSGIGLGMKAAEKIGFTAFGVEISQDAVNYSQQEFGLLRSYCGTLEEVDLPDNFFEAIYAWHVIEHVASLTDWLEKIKRVLKPNGVILVGTENNTDLFYTLKRYAKILLGQVPDLSTASEHTYGFTPKVLTKILRHFGFEVLELMVYEDNARNSFCGQVKRGGRATKFIKKIMLHILYGISQVFPTGKKMRVVARKKVEK